MYIIAYLITFLVFTLNMGETVFGQVFKNSVLGLNSNVTQDMLDLLTKAVGKAQNDQLHSKMNSSEPSINIEAGDKQGETTYGEITIVKPSYPISLEDKNIPEGGFMYIYDMFPYIISEARLTAKLPCNEENRSLVDIIGGRMLEFDRITTDFIPRYSDTGELCLYQSLINSNSTRPISEIALINNSTENIEFPATSTIVLSVANLTHMR